MPSNDRYYLTAHAAQRMAQRNLTPDEVALALRYGRRSHRAHAEFFFLGTRDLPPGAERELARIVGTTVVVCAGRYITTVYRNPRAGAKIKRKPKRYYGPGCAWLAERELELKP